MRGLLHFCDDQRSSYSRRALFRYYGFRVYSAALDAASLDDLKQDRYRLSIEYERQLRKQDIIANAVWELKNQGVEVTDDVLAKLDALIIDVEPGDTLIGVREQDVLRMYYKGDQQQLLGEVHDAQFTEAFFGIWLSERTSYRRLRAELLHQ